MSANIRPNQSQSPEDVSSARQPKLTLDEEIRLAKSIEQAERNILEAIAHSGSALQELDTLCAELRGGVVGWPALLRVPPEKRDSERVLEDVSNAVQDLIGAASRPSPRELEAAAREKARAHFVATFLRERLSRQAIQRIIQRLRDISESDSGSSKAAPEHCVELVVDNLKQGETARTALVQANLGLVTWMARKRWDSGLSKHDLIQDGCLGLMRAIEKFDYRRGVRFNTYAVWWVRAFINRALSDYARMIRLPVHTVELQSKASKQIERFSKAHGRLPTLVELSAATEVPKEKLREVLDAPKRPRSLDAPASHDNKLHLSEVTPDQNSPSPLQDVAIRDTEQRVRQLLELLSPREQEILKLRFGFHGPGDMTLEEIGRRFSLSRERVRQIEGAALGKLRDMAAADDLDLDLAN